MTLSVWRIKITNQAKSYHYVVDLIAFICQRQVEILKTLYNCYFLEFKSNLNPEVGNQYQESSRIQRSRVLLRNSDRLLLLLLQVKTNEQLLPLLAILFWRLVNPPTSTYVKKIAVEYSRSCRAKACFENELDPRQHLPESVVFKHASWTWRLKQWNAMDKARLKKEVSCSLPRSTTK